MVDFAKMLEENLARMTPAERAAYDARVAEEARIEATARPIQAKFEWTAFARPWAKPRDLSTRVVRQETREIRMRIEPSGENETIRFVGGPTGHEAYRLDAEFVARLRAFAEAKGDDLFICAGTPGSWASCRVSIQEVLAYIQESRPDLAPAALPAPAP